MVYSQLLRNLSPELRENFRDLLLSDAELESVNADELVTNILRKLADLLERYYANIFYLLRTYRVKSVNENQVKIVAAFLAYQANGISVCTEQMIRFVTKDIMENAGTNVMPTLHKLGDFRVLQVIKTPSTKNRKERYRFLLMDHFLAHIGDWWKSENG